MDQTTADWQGRPMKVRKFQKPKFRVGACTLDYAPSSTNPVGLVKGCIEHVDLDPQGIRYHISRADTTESHIMTEVEARRVVEPAAHKFSNTTCGVAGFSRDNAQCEREWRQSAAQEKHCP